MSPLSILDSFCLINDSRSFKYKLGSMHTVAAGLTSQGASLSGKNVLELGAGIHNPLGSGLISLAFGASVATAFQWFAIRIEHRTAEFLRQLPRGFVGDAKLVLQLQRRHAVRMGRHQMRSIDSSPCRR